MQDKKPVLARRILMYTPLLLILSYLLLPFLVGHDHDRIKTHITRANLVNVGDKLRMFKVNHGRFPDHLEDLFRRPDYIPEGNWTGAYLEERGESETAGWEIPPRDAWGHELEYEVPGSAGRPFDLYSLGADNKPGGKGFDADIWFPEYSPTPCR